MDQAKYKRLILKLSGEALAGSKGYGIDPAVVYSIAVQIKEVVEIGAQISIVVGGGNIWRGVAGSTNAFLQSIIPAPVLSRNSLTLAADISAIIIILPTNA